MTRLSAAVLGANGNIYNAAEAFLNTTVAIKGTAGSADDVKSAITAMVQIYSKGKVSAEELSGQLGERFPAAVTKFAKANDISTQALQKSLKDGTVGLDMLSKFVTSLGKEYAPLAEEIAKSNEEAGARAQIAMNKMRIAVGTELKDVGAQFQIIGANLLTSLVPVLRVVGNIGAKVFGALAGTIKFVVDNFDKFASVAAVAGGVMAGLATQALVVNAAMIAWDLKLTISLLWKKVAALKALTLAQIKMNIAAMANPYVLLAAGLSATAIWAFKAAQAHDKLVDSLESGVATEDDVTKAFKERLKLQKEMKRIETSTAFKYRDEEDRAAAIEKLKTKYDELTTAIETYRKNANDPYQLEKLKKQFDSLLGSGTGDDSPLQKFRKEIDDVTTQLENVVVNAFKGMEDALTNFVMTGKLNFREFARSVIADITRIAIRQAIIAPILGAFGIGNPTPTSTTGTTNSAKGNVFAQNGIVPYAKGGIVNSPTLFPFAKGVGLMGEAGPEAIVPLKRGRDGKLGIAGGGGATTVNVSVDAKGTKVEGDGKQMAQLGRMIGAAIEMELAKQKRPGGLLA